MLERVQEHVVGDKCFVARVQTTPIATSKREYMRYGLLMRRQLQSGRISMTHQTLPVIIKIWDHSLSHATQTAQSGLQDQHDSSNSACNHKDLVCKISMTEQTHPVIIKIWDHSLSHATQTAQSGLQDQHDSSNSPYKRSGIIQFPHIVR